jgi:hypothetical protein
MTVAARNTRIESQLRARKLGKYMSAISQGSTMVGPDDSTDSSSVPCLTTATRAPEAYLGALGKLGVQVAVHAKSTKRNRKGNMSTQVSTRCR